MPKTTVPRNILEERNRGRRRARTLFSASLMSNTKWRTVFVALTKLSPELRQIILKFTDEEKELTLGLPSLHPPYPYVESAAMGPFPLVDIEWIEIPVFARFIRSNNLPPALYPQDIIAVRNALEATGKKFLMRESPTGLRIIGHIR